MPELPEVENAVRDLKPLLVGRRVVDVHVGWPGLLGGMDWQEFAWRLRDRQIINADRRGKYLLFPLDDSETLVVHLRMTGQLRVDPSDTARGAYDHIVFELDNATELRYRDSRKFGRMTLTSDTGALLRKLGPEPLAQDYTPVDLYLSVMGRRSAIKALLLNQSIVAGLGNIYADEALFHARINPRTPACDLTQADCIRLHSAIRQTLTAAIREGGSTLGGSDVTNYRRPNGVTGHYQHRHHVYGRAGKPCTVCGTPIAKVRVAQRGTHFCPSCQGNAVAY